LTASFERYYAEGVRTFIAGNSGFSEVNDEKINELYQQIMAAVKPGKSASQFYKETINEFRRKDVKYIPDYGLGHGIGLSLKELPFFDEKDTNQFPEGMCFVLRIGIRDQEGGAILTGNTICLSETGTEVLTA
jgi:Xaa-Pro aminopeptidase